MSQYEDSIVIYAAGGLFDIAQLIANVLLKHSIEKTSGQLLKVTLPQDIELSSHDPRSIKHADLFAVLTADCGIINMDGIEVDSGTLVEFMIMKALDMPTVLYRTDFRKAGDQESEPWNLMLSGWPNCRSVVVDSMALYKNESREHRDPLRLPELLAEKLGVSIVGELKKLFANLNSKTPDDNTVRQRITLAIDSLGEEFKEFLRREQDLNRFIEERTARALFVMSRAGQV